MVLHMLLCDESLEVKSALSSWVNFCVGYLLGTSDPMKLLAISCMFAHAKSLITHSVGCDNCDFDVFLSCDHDPSPTSQS